MLTVHEVVESADSINTFKQDCRKCVYMQKYVMLTVNLIEGKWTLVSYALGFQCFLACSKIPIIILSASSPLLKTHNSPRPPQTPAASF